MQALDAAADERARRRHGDAGLLARNRQHAAVGDGRQRFLEAAGDHCSERDDFARVAIPLLSPRHLPAYVLSQNLAQDSDCFTLSGENGTRRMRTPVASKMAFAMAAATGRIEGSPAPLGAISGWLISTTSMLSGVSVMSRIGYVIQSRLVTFLASNLTSSHKVRLTPWTMLPSIVCLSPSGLMIWPQSWATVNLRPQILPVARSISTSATMAHRVPLRWA